ncbi:unnamed protein product [Cunninghamella blakesleeana]
MGSPFFILISVFNLLLATIAHDAHYLNQLVFDTTQIKVQDILAQQNNVNKVKAHIKQFKGSDTLGYITPWNNKGMDIAKIYKGKFDYISPVWFNVHNENGDIRISGEHDIDIQWMDDVKLEVNGQRFGKIVPRFHFKDWNMDGYQLFTKSLEEQDLLSKKIVDLTKKYKFDGIVLECGLPTVYLSFLQKIANDLHEIDKEFILVLPPLRKEYNAIINAEVYDFMSHFIDRFSLMTYDYSSNKIEGGPNSPIDWVIDNIESLTNKKNRHQLLVGMNLYAMSYSSTRYPEPLIMDQVIKKLDISHDSLDDDDDMDITIYWDKENEEHWFHEIDEDGINVGTIWMPTIKSIQKRIHIAEDYQTGISLWELGQGLNYFYNDF